MEELSPNAAVTEQWLSTALDRFIAPMLSEREKLDPFPSVHVRVTVLSGSSVLVIVIGFARSNFSTPLT